MSQRGSLFSPYQCREKGLTIRQYSQGNIVSEQEKINKVLANYNSFNPKRKRLADKFLIRWNKNINFFIGMINQQNIEK